MHFSNILLSLIALLLLVSVVLFKKQPDNYPEFRAYKNDWNKKYENNEIEQFRLTIFYENLKTINEHNMKGTESYWLGINQFTDQTNEECIETYLGDNGEVAPQTYDYSQDKGVGTEVDWVEKGMVSEVKNQGSCGSCYAFGGVSNVESMYRVFGKKEYDLSEQQVVDCSQAYGNQGCGGGLATNVFKFVKEKGLTTQKEYPYVGVAGKCKIPTGDIKVKGHTEWNQKGCDQLETEIQTRPISVRVYAQNWFSYAGGIFTKCDAPGYGHAVNLVGISTTQGFWKVRNSWGPKWGEKGYIRLKYPGNCCNLCGDFSCSYLA